MHIHPLKIFFLLIVSTISLRATMIPFELVGEFQGVLRQPYQQHFCLEDVLVMSTTGVIENSRFYLAVGAPDEGLQLTALPNTGGLTNFVNFRAPRMPDVPVDFVAFFLQRTFPSQDGINIIPNHLSKDDPVKSFTQETAGVILNMIRDYYIRPPEDRKLFARNLAFAIDHNLNPTVVPIRYEGSLKQIEDAQVKREKTKKHMCIADFAETVVRALDDAARQPCYAPYFIHKMLYAFALKKIGVARDPRAAMMAFYTAMPDVVRPDFQRGQPFSRGMYTELTERLKLLYDPSTNPEHKQAAIERYGKNYRLSLREEICLLYGIKCFENLFSKEHYLSTAQYNGVSFSNCGELLPLNWLNLFLYDFANKRIRVELLEAMDGVYAPLKDYYGRFSTEAAQQSEDGQAAWTRVVSGHNREIDPDIYYHKGNGTCEILHGISSMAGILRALFPDEEHSRIRNDRSITALERATATIEHMAQKFSNANETWTWSVDKAEKDKEHVISKNDIVIHFAKSGQNVPMDESEPITDDILTLTFEHGHYDASFSSGAQKAYMHYYSINASRGLVEKNEPLSEIDCALVAPHLFALLTENTFEEDDSDIESIVYKQLFFSLPVSKQTRLTNSSILYFPLQNSTLRAVVFTFLLANKNAPYYLMAANLLESLTCEDPLTVSLFLMNYLDDQAQLTGPTGAHPRIDSRYAFMSNTVKDPKFAYDCLALNTGVSKLDQFIMQHIPEGSLTKEQVLQMVREWSDDEDTTRKTWEIFIRRYGNVFQDPLEILLDKQDPNGNSVIDNLLLNGKQEVIEWLIENGWLTKKLLIEHLREVVPSAAVAQAELEVPAVEQPRATRSTLLNRFPGRKMTPEMKKFLMLVKTFGLTKNELKELNANMLGLIFCTYQSNDTDLEVELPDATCEIIATLHLTKEDFLSTNEFPLLGTMLSIHKQIQLWAWLEPFIRELKIARDDLVGNAQLLRQIQFSDEQTQDWFLERGLINRTDILSELGTIMVNGGQETVERFTRKGWLTKQILIEHLREDIPNAAVAKTDLETPAVEQPRTTRYTLLSQISGTKLTPAMKLFLMLVKKFDLTKDEITGMCPRVLDSIFCWKSSQNSNLEAEFPDVTSDIIATLRLTKEDFLSKTQYPLLGSLLLHQKEPKPFALLECLIRTLGFTRDDLVGNSNILYNIQTSDKQIQEWFLERELIKDTDLKQMQNAT